MFRDPKLTFMQGHWTGATEQAATRRVINLPKVFEKVRLLSNELSSDSSTFNNILKEIKSLMIATGRSFSVDNVQATKICELQLIPKPDQDSDNLVIDIYRINLKDIQNAYLYFCVDKNETIQGSLRIHYKKHSAAADAAYIGEHFSIEGVESHLRSQYSVGTVLVQLALEHILQAGHDGKLTAYSISNSSLFYYKLGFTAISEAAMKNLDNGISSEGVLFFLAQMTIEAWKERISNTPILKEKTGQTPLLLR